MSFLQIGEASGPNRRADMVARPPPAQAEQRPHIGRRDEAQSRGELVLFELLIPPNARVPAPHHHEGVDEVAYGLAGVLTATVDGRKHELGAGDLAFISRGSVHHHENLHPGPARTLVVLTPGSIGRRYFEEIGSEVNGPAKPDPRRVKEIMLRHGLVPAA